MMAKRKLVTAVLTLLIFIGLAWLLFFQGRMLQEYRILTPLKQLKSEQVDQVLQPYIGQEFWRLNLSSLHAKLLQLDWVYKATVTRKWPGTLAVSIEEQNPIVRWGDDALLNQNGDIFYPRSIKPFQGYVILSGEDKNSKDLLKHLVAFQKSFGKLGWLIQSIEQQVDSSWLINFMSGTSVRVGYKNWQAKIDLFIEAYPKIKRSLRKQAKLYDLRYSNGLSLIHI